MPKIAITHDSLKQILHLINVWDGKLTWPLLCDKASKLLNIDGITRQTLSGYKELQEAFTERKQFLRDHKPTDAINPMDSNVEYLLSQIKNLEAELASANKTVERYKQRFILWQYNAYRHGIRMESLDDAVEMLEKPLSEINRRTGGR